MNGFRCVSIATLFALAACGGSDDAPEPARAHTSAIIGGAPDDASVSTVYINVKAGNQSGGCSAVVVSPHVVLTAGHCAKPNGEYSIFLGSDFNDKAQKAKSDNYVPVAEHHPHPRYSQTRNLNDIGVLITSAPIPRMPAALNRTALAKNDVGAAIRLTGFGQTLAGDKNSIGRRMAATTKLVDYDDEFLTMKGTPSFCLFDSGGPTFMKRSGADVIVGIHVIVQSTACNEEAYDTRVDAYADFVDEYIAKFDPPEPPAPEPAPPSTTPESTDSSGCSVGPTTNGRYLPASLFCLGLIALARIVRRRVPTSSMESGRAIERR